LRDNAKETDFVVDTFVVLADSLHKPRTRISHRLNVKRFVVTSDAFDQAGRAEQVREILDLQCGDIN
jgi:hypothetical protein